MGLSCFFKNISHRRSIILNLTIIIIIIIIVVVIIIIIIIIIIAISIFENLEGEEKKSLCRNLPKCHFYHSIRRFFSRSRRLDLFCEKAVVQFLLKNPRNTFMIECNLLLSGRIEGVQNFLKHRLHQIKPAT